MFTRPQQSLNRSSAERRGACVACYPRRNNVAVHGGRTIDPPPSISSRLVPADTVFVRPTAVTGNLSPVHSRAHTCVPCAHHRPAGVRAQALVRVPFDKFGLRTSCSPPPHPRSLPRRALTVLRTRAGAPTWPPSPAAPIVFGTADSNKRIDPHPPPLTARTFFSIGLSYTFRFEWETLAACDPRNDSFGFVKRLLFSFVFQRSNFSTEVPGLNAFVGETYGNSVSPRRPGAVGFIYFLFHQYGLILQNYIIITARPSSLPHVLFTCKRK